VLGAPFLKKRKKWKKKKVEEQRMAGYEKFPSGLRRLLNV